MMSESQRQNRPRPARPGTVSSWTARVTGDTQVQASYWMEHRHTSGTLWLRPAHRSKVSTAVQQATTFWFPGARKFMCTLPCSLVSVQQHCA